MVKGRIKGINMKEDFKLYSKSKWFHLIAMYLASLISSVYMIYLMSKESFFDLCEFLYYYIPEIFHGHFALSNLPPVINEHKANLIGSFNHHSLVGWCLLMTLTIPSAIFVNKHQKKIVSFR